MPNSITNKYNELRVWLRSPVAENQRHRIIREAQSFFMSILRILILAGISYIILSPMIGIISNAFKSIRDVYNPLVYVIPEFPNLDNMRYAIIHMDFWRVLTRTMVFTLSITLIQVVITSMVGYGFARFRFPFRETLFALVILTIVLPVQTYLVPMYMQFRYFKFFGMEFNLINSYMPVILLTLTGMGLRSGLYIFIFRQFFRGLPKEIEEAALIDGAGQFRTYFQVMMPNSLPAIITVVMFAMVWQYNDTHYTSVFMGTIGSLATRLTALAATFNAREEVNDPNLTQLVVNAGIILVVLPILTIYLAMQRYFMEGIERSGIVG
jgi:multiple sugar transport system permease protein